MYLRKFSDSQIGVHDHTKGEKGLRVRFLQKFNEFILKPSMVELYL